MTPDRAITPKTVVAWIDRLRDMLDETEVPFARPQDVLTVVKHELDALELDALRETVLTAPCRWVRDHRFGCWSCTVHSAAHRTAQHPERCHRAPA